MKKLVITILLAMATSLTIYFISFWTPSNNIIDIEKSRVNNVGEGSNEKNIEDNKKNDVVSKDNIKDKGDKSKLSDESIKNKKENLLNEKDNKLNYNEEIKKDINHNNEGKSSEASVKIFNVNKNEIFESLSLKDKTKLLSVAKKISTVDGEKIKNSIKNEDEFRGVSEAFKIIKLRLTKKDYNEVKEILSPYINIELLEQLV